MCNEIFGKRRQWKVEVNMMTIVVLFPHDEVHRSVDGDCDETAGRNWKGKIETIKKYMRNIHVRIKSKENQELWMKSQLFDFKRSSWD